ncbi:MAG TPA: hypothetical protein VNC78_10915 [Actinomycetota bacterium]|nr:hypothetical protein [Actinomycetota bacterium]
MAPFVVLVALFFTVDGVLGKVDVSLAAGAAAIALGGVFVGRAVRGWPLDNSTPQRVGESYQSRLWNAYAAIQLPLLLCFMASLLRDELWPYLTVLPIHLVGLASIAPGLADIARRQEELRRAGSTVSLADALQFPPWRSPSP